MITGIILSGGKSKRIGKDKNLLLLNGETMISCMVNIIRFYVDDIIIITNEKEKYSFLKNISFKKDIIKNKGPAGGIYTGLHYSKTELSFIISCDMPYMKGKFISFMLNKLNNKLAAIPYNGKYFEPLASIYNKKLEYFFYYSIKCNNLKLQNLLNLINISKVDTKNIYKNFGKKIFYNINTNKNYKTILKDINREI